MTHSQILKILREKQDTTEIFTPFCRKRRRAATSSSFTMTAPITTSEWPAQHNATHYFTSAAVAVDSSHMTASSSTSWSRLFSPPSNFVNVHVSTMWFTVRRWPQSQQGDWVRPHLCKLARHGPWSVWKWFVRDHVWRERWKPGCRIVGLVTVVWLTTEADDQSFLHCVIVSTDVMSDHIGHRDASCGGGRSKTSAYTGQFGWASIIWSILSVAALWHRGGAALLSNTDYLKLDTSRHIMSEMTWLKWIIAFIIFTVRLVAYHNNSQFHWINSSQ